MATLAHTNNHLIPRSAVRYRPFYAKTEEVQFTKPRASRPPITQASHATSRPIQKKIPPSPHWTIWVGGTMVLMVCVLWIGQAFWSWGTILHDDFRYGRPRTMQMETFVGHEAGQKPSHFIVLNIDGQAQVIQLPGGDSRKARLYLGPQLHGTGADLALVTLHFVPGRDAKYPDMVIHVNGVETRYINNKNQFTLQQK